MPTKELSPADLHLCQDPVLQPFVQRIYLSELEPTTDIYARLIRAIVYQQLSGKAAGTIHGRFLQLFPEGYPHPEELLAVSFADLRGVGLSAQKATYLQAVAQQFLDHGLSAWKWQEHSDEEIIRELTAIKGVGLWTVQMLLIFALERPDVLPLDDLVVRQSIQQLYGIEGKGKAMYREMEAVAEAWRPYRSLASRYLWRVKDTQLPGTDEDGW